MIRASLGKLILESKPLAPFTEVMGMKSVSLKILQSVVPITTKAMYGMLWSAFTFTVPELLRNIHTKELVMIGINAQKNPKNDCRY